MTTPCFYHGRDNLDYVVLFSINGHMYEYFLPTLTMVDACDYIAKRFPLLGLNYAKKRATRTVERTTTNA